MKAGVSDIIIDASLDCRCVHLFGVDVQDRDYLSTLGLIGDRPLVVQT